MSFQGWKKRLLNVILGARGVRMRGGHHWSNQMLLKLLDIALLSALDPTPGSFSAAKARQPIPKE